MNPLFLAGVASLPVRAGAWQGNSLTQFVHLGPASLTVLAVLFLFSVITWTIVLQKVCLHRRLRKASLQISNLLCEEENLASLASRCSQFPLSPEAQLIRVAEQGLRNGASPRQLEHLLLKTASFETRKLESYLAFLATAGSTTPFIGLFGTVWGIMNAFQGIGLKGSANLATVAPGIAEALIATAAGLAAAIPAVMAYNFFNRWIEVTEGDLRDLAMDLFMEYGPESAVAVHQTPIDKTTYPLPGSERRRRRTDRERGEDAAGPPIPPAPRTERRAQW